MAGMAQFAVGCDHISGQDGISKDSWRCTICELYMCYTCGTQNISLVDNKNHKVFNVHDQNKPPILKPMKCGDHYKNYTSVYCKKCDKFLCANCLLESNHQRDQLQELEALYQEKIEKLQNCSTKIEEGSIIFFQKEFKRFKALAGYHTESNEREKQKIIKHDRELKEKISRQTKKLLEELETHLEHIKQEMGKNRAIMKQNIIDSRMKLSVIEEIKNTIDIKELCSATKEIEDVLNTESSFLPLPSTAKTFIKGEENGEKLSDLIGSLGNKYIQNSSLIEFKVLKTYSTKSSLNSSLAPVTDGTCWIANYTYLRKITFGHDKLIPVREQQISLSNTSNIALMKSEDLLITCDDEPFIIKRLTPSYKLEIFYKFPRGLLTKPQKPISLHVHSDGSVMVGTAEKGGFPEDTLSESSHRQVVTLSPQGELLKTFENDKGGKRLFQWPGRVTTNSNGDICVLDFSKLISLNSSGILKWTYNTGNSIHYCEYNSDILTTSNDNIIFGEKTILYILNCDGEIITNLKLRIDSLHCMAIDHKGQLLLCDKSLEKNNGKIHLLSFTGF